MYTFLNDTFLPAGEASLHIGDLAFQRGYGIFDFFKTIHDRPIFPDDHLDRFFHSADRMRLPVGKTRHELTAILAELCRLNRLPDSGIRLMLTGGYSPDGYSLAQPNFVITQQPLLYPLAAECPSPIRLISHAHQRQLPDVKTIDYLMAIHLQPHLRERGAADVLYQQNGIITECPRSNFFLVTADDTLVTPARNMLKGITRMKILELAAGFLRTAERDVLLSEIPTAKEAFISSTGRHITPVSHIDDHPIGAAHGNAPDARPGPITQQLNARLYDLVFNGK